MEAAETQEQVRFENRFYHTFPTLFPVYWKLASVRRYLYIFSVILALVSLFIFVDTPDAVYILLGLGLIALSFPALQAWLAARIHRKLMNGEVPEAIVHYTNTEIQCNEARNESHYQYSQIRRVRSTRNFWLLMFNRQIALIVRKEGFTAGRKEDFPAFIRSKCPGIKGSFK